MRSPSPRMPLYTTFKELQMFDALGVLPEEIRPFARVEDETHIIIRTRHPRALRMTLLVWLEQQFFPYEIVPIEEAQALLGVATISAPCLPKTIRIDIQPEG